MRKFFHDLFNDHNSINEKAVIGFMAFVMMCIFAFVDIVTGAMNKPLLINEFIFIGSFGSAGRRPCWPLCFIS